VLSISVATHNFLFFIFFFRSVADRFDYSKSTLNAIFFRIITILNGIASEFIKWPSREEMDVSMEAFGRNNQIKKVIGAIDGTYVPISVPDEQRPAYTNRKSFTSMTLQAICDHRMLFLDCFAGYPSSAHDLRVFRNSDIYQDIMENSFAIFPDGEKILGDGAYPVETWLMSPYKNYGGSLTEQQKYFNTKLSSARQVIERSFSLLFGRFRRLNQLEMHRIDAIPAFIISCCVLHNMCLRFEDPDIRIYMREGRLLLASQLEPDDNQHANANRNQQQNNPEQERERIAMELYSARDNN
jgi:DDE superfamily endonuclease